MGPTLNQCSIGAVLVETKHVSTFLYLTGDISDDILAMLNIDKSTIKYTNLLATSDTHFAACNNVIFVQVRFNQRMQKLEEAMNMLSRTNIDFQRTVIILL